MDGQAGATAQSKEFGKREKAAEDQWARQKEAEQLKALKEAMSKKESKEGQN
ncbi:hypothetical protein K501DRAFT_285639 [Backusella circina FSU 941]|nr:hypothetical protein K501DRAFT_285639 [Backusella circina FSU 941]